MSPPRTRPAAPTVPRERTETVRASLREALATAGGPLTARELSHRVGIPEKEVATHLLHLRQSLKAEGRRLAITPAECLACGFRFEKRDRMTKPGRCPDCDSERIDPPLFAVEE